MPRCHIFRDLMITDEGLGFIYRNDCLPLPLQAISITRFRCLWHALLCFWTVHAA